MFGGNKSEANKGQHKINQVSPQRVQKVSEILAENNQESAPVNTTISID